MSEHRITLVYPTDDDGVWLWCTCGWQENLGFNPTPERAMEQSEAHRAATSPGNDK